MNKINQIRDYTYALACSPNFKQDNICFAARGSGLYRSDDLGKSWTYLYGGLNGNANAATVSVVTSPGYQNDKTIFAAVPGGILRSTNDGKEWTASTFIQPPPIPTKMLLSPNFSNDQIVFSATLDDGVFRSVNSGASWSGWNFGLLDLHVHCLAISRNFTIDETIFAGCDSGVFKSNNGGRGWLETNFPMHAGPVSSLALSPGYSRDKTLWAGTDKAGLFCSFDDGVNWQRVDTLYEGNVIDIYLSPTYPNLKRILMILPNRIMLSNDNGGTWKEVKGSLLEDEITCSTAPNDAVSGESILIGYSQSGIQFLTIP